MLAEVRSRAPGNDPSMPTVHVELPQDRTTLRELIRVAVAEQVSQLRMDAIRCRQLLDRQYMTDADVAAAAKHGVVKISGPPDAAVPPDVDAEVEVRRALRAFERHAFVVFNGGRQVEHLDDELTIRLGQPVVFLRLTALVGG